MQHQHELASRRRPCRDGDRASTRVDPTCPEQRRHLVGRPGLDSHGRPPTREDLGDVGSGDREHVFVREQSGEESSGAGPFGVVETATHRPLDRVESALASLRIAQRSSGGDPGPPRRALAVDARERAGLLLDPTDQPRSRDSAPGQDGLGPAREPVHVVLTGHVLGQQTLVDPPRESTARVEVPVQGLPALGATQGEEPAVTVQPERVLQGGAIGLDQG